MLNRINDHINEKIMENELSVEDWVHNELAWELYWWVDFFNAWAFRNQPVPIPAISFERTKVSTLGHYVIGRNSMGINENINLNSLYLNRPMWDIIATLVHELCHSNQKIYGKPSNSWFHNKEFKDKMLSIGILCNDKGCHVAIGDPFVFMLKKHGIKFDLPNNKKGSYDISSKFKKKGTSKLKKWTCGCTNVRVAISDFQAKCLKCNKKFELV